MYQHSNKSQERTFAPGHLLPEALRRVVLPDARQCIYEEAEREKPKKQSKHRILSRVKSTAQPCHVLDSGATIAGIFIYLRLHPIQLRIPLGGDFFSRPLFSLGTLRNIIAIRHFVIPVNVGLSGSRLNVPGTPLWSSSWQFFKIAACYKYFVPIPKGTAPASPHLPLDQSYLVVPTKV